MSTLLSISILWVSLQQEVMEVAMVTTRTTKHMQIIIIIIIHANIKVTLSQ